MLKANQSNPTFQPFSEDLPYAMSTVVDKGTQKIWVEDRYTYKPVFMFSYSGSGSFTEISKSTTTKIIKIAFIKTFDTNKHFITYYEEVSGQNIFYCGISADSFPFSKGRFANASYFTNDSVKPNTLDGVKYYSLTDVPAFTDITQVVKLTDGTYTNTGNCPGDKLFTFVGSIKHCLNSCPTGRIFKENVANNILCRTECYHTNSALYTDIHTCLTGLCPANSLKFYGDPNNRLCTAQCENDYLYLDGDNCRDKCGDFMIPSTDHYTSTETGECVATCDTSTKFLIEEASQTYQDTTIKKYCLDSCSDSPYTQYKHDGSVNRCVQHCQSGEFLDLQSLSSDYTLSLIDEIHKECISTCAGYQFESSKQFASSANKFYCLPVCPDGYYKAEIGANNNICYEKCSLSANHKYTFLLSCLTVCDWSETPFVDEIEQEKHCLSSCSSTKKHFKTQGSAKICIAACLENEMIRYKGTNYQESILKDITESTECVASCTDFKLNNQLLDDLPHENDFCLDQCPIGMYSVEVSPTDKYCIRECDVNSFFKFSTPDFRCVSSCTGVGFKFTTEDNNCTDECSLFIDEDTKCVSECPKERFFIDNYHCLETCPFERQFISDFKECVSECPDRFHGDYCVTICGEETLVQFYSDNSIPLDSRLFTLSTKECSAECSEDGITLIDEDSLDCLEECPEEGNRFKAADNYCRKTCSNPEYPFLDEKSKECLVECKPERPFLSENACLERCPSSARLVLQRALCGPDVCEKDCEEVRSECLATCLPEAPFTLEHETFAECVCVCPEGFTPNSQKICEFDCAAALGFTRDDQDNCFHCFDDKGGLYLEGEKCVEKCSSGHFASLKGACLPCKAVGMWENEKGECIQEEQCEKFSQKNNSAKTCFKCSGEGLKLVVEEGKTPKCTESDCSAGHLEKESVIDFCFICNLGKFYHNRSCLEDCPVDQGYDFVTKRCVDSCYSSCSNKCCMNGRCVLDKCECKEGFTGTRCDIPLENSLELSKEVIRFAQRRLTSRLLLQNEIELLQDLVLSLGTNRMLDASVFEVRGFLTNAIILAEQWYIKHSFQPALFDLLDKMLGLAMKIDLELEDNITVSTIVSLIDSFSDNILTSEGISPDFKVVDSGSIKGKYYEMMFSSDIATQTEVMLGSCLNSLSTGQKPFKLLKFGVNVSNLILRRDKLAILLSESPLTEVSVFLMNRKIDLNLDCSPADVATEFTPELDVSQLSLAERFKSSSFNVFDSNDKFFVDRCVPFSEDGRDITLAERKKLQVDKKQLCNESAFNICQVKQTDTGKPTCKCEGIGNSKKSALEGVVASYPDTNYILFTCFSVFRNASISENKGLLIVGLPFALGILMAFIYSLRVNNDLQDNRKYRYLRQDYTIFNPKKMSTEVYFKEANRLHTLKLRHKKRHFTREDLKHLPTIGDLKYLSAEELLVFDLRSNWQFTLDTLTELHPIGKIFFKNSLRLAPTFQIMIFVTETNLTTMASAFFIDDSMVAAKNENGDPSLMDSVSSQLVQTIWAVLTSISLMKIVKVLVKVDLVRKNKVGDHILGEVVFNPIRIYNYYSTKYRLKLVVFLLICLCLNLVFVYFVVIYLELYSNSQVIWFNGIIMGLAIKHLGVKMIIPASLIVSRILARQWPSTISLFKLVLKIYLKVAKRD